MEIGGKPKSTLEIQGQYMGLLRFVPNAWYEVKRIRESLDSEVRDCMDMTTLLQNIIDAGNISVVGEPYHGEWGEIDSADDLAIY